MAKSTTVSVARRNAAIDSLLALDGGTVEWRTGSPPATPETAATGTLLATSNLNADAFAAATSAAAAMNSVSNVTAGASGDVGYARFKNSGGTAVMDMTCGESADTPNIVFDEKSWLAGDTISFTSLSFSMPASSSL